MRAAAVRHFATIGLAVVVVGMVSVAAASAGVEPVVIGLVGAFLTACAVIAWVEYAPELVRKWRRRGRPHHRIDVFVSYDTPHANIASSLADALRRGSRVTVWLDHLSVGRDAATYATPIVPSRAAFRRLPGSAPVVKRLENAGIHVDELRRSQVVVVLADQESDPVRDEVSLAGSNQTTVVTSEAGPITSQRDEDDLRTVVQFLPMSSSSEIQTAALKIVDLGRSSIEVLS